MVDIGYGVAWALERPCSLRSGEDWFTLDRTAQQLSPISSFNSSVRDGLILDDVCITSWWERKVRNDHTVRLPKAGYRLSLTLAPLGGETAIRAACGSCEANVGIDTALTLAGCRGYLDIWPISERLEDDLRARIAEKGLADSVAHLFHPTNPLWYGFWMESPLRRARCELLLALSDSFADKRGDELTHFVAALRAAIDWELPLHVMLTPPCDFDWYSYTIFPHCPQCKAFAPVEQEPYPDTPTLCPVCGHWFSPATTYEKGEPGEAFSLELENLLGAEGATDFKRRFLAHQGCSPAQIEDVLNRKNECQGAPDRSEETGEVPF
jgi:hypothetical protein